VLLSFHFRNFACILDIDRLTSLDTFTYRSNLAFSLYNTPFPLNMQSMDKLLDMSASTLRKSDDIINIGVKKVSFLVCHLVLLMLLTRMDEDELGFQQRRAHSYR